MQLSIRRWDKNKDSASVNFGPLSFSLEIGQKWVKYASTDAWPEQEVYATTPYNYGLILDEANPTASIEMIRANGPLADQPFTSETAPIRLKMKAKQIPNWGLDRHDLLRTLEPGPVRSDQPIETISLIPMGQRGSESPHSLSLAINQMLAIGLRPKPPQGSHRWQPPALRSSMIRSMP